MTAAQILRAALALPLEERAAVADRLVASLAEDAPPEITRLQLDQVRRRIAEVESGFVTLIPGEEALEQVRALAGSPITGARQP
jgi:putative addiction module component (TIGR02574 family)